MRTSRAFSYTFHFTSDEIRKLQIQADTLNLSIEELLEQRIWDQAPKLIAQTPLPAATVNDYVIPSALWTPQPATPAPAAPTQAPAPSEPAAAAAPEKRDYTRLPSLVNRVLTPATIHTVKTDGAHKSSDNAPRGVDAVMAAAKTLRDGRAKVRAQFPNSTSRDYKMAMHQFYVDNGMKNWDYNTRWKLGHIADHFDEITAWLKMASLVRLPASNTSAYQVLARWEKRNATPPARQISNTFSKEPPQLRKNANPTAKKIADTLAAEGKGPIYRNGRFEIGEILRDTPLSPASDPVRAPEKIVYQTFEKVDMTRLDPSEARVLRRFSERLLMTTTKVTTGLPQDKVAAVVNKIKAPGEKGNTPPTAQTLLRLGVLAGSSGAYNLRQEFVERLDDVQKWTHEMAPA